MVNDPLYNHTVFGPEKGRGGNIGKSDEELIRDLISIHNAENWLGMDGDSELSMFKPTLLNFDEEDKGMNVAGNWEEIIIALDEYVHKICKCALVSSIGSSIYIMFT